MNFVVDCVEPGRNHDLRGKRVWWETGDGTFELTVNSTLYVEDIEDEECEIFMRSTNIFHLFFVIKIFFN